MYSIWGIFIISVATILIQYTVNLTKKTIKLNNLTQEKFDSQI